VLRPYRKGILLQTIYYADEVREMESFGTDDVHVKEGEIKVAHQLVKALEGKFQPEKFHDTFEENVKKLIKAKLEGTEVVAVEKPKAPAKVVDLMDALKQSLAQMEGKKKGPGRVTEAERESKLHVAKKKSGGKKKAA
jgi:DNA end-binding protein Ku